MSESGKSSFILGISMILGLSALGCLLGGAALDYRQYERTVTVKGLSEREYEANIVIWPIQFTEAGNDLEELYVSLDQGVALIRTYLEDAGVESDEITVSTPSITDKSAQEYGGRSDFTFRYTASQSVTVYSENIAAVRNIMGTLSELGRHGLVITGGNYQSRTEYIFTRLNEVKPAMIEEATRNAREVAEKFADDSRSSLGKIKKALQGQFSIRDRDTNNPHIKVVRVVSTIEYYLSD